MLSSLSVLCLLLRFAACRSFLSQEELVLRAAVCLVPITFNVGFVYPCSNWCWRDFLNAGGHIKLKEHKKHPLFCHQTKSSQKFSKWPRPSSPFPFFNAITSKMLGDELKHILRIVKIKYVLVSTKNSLLFIPEDVYLSVETLLMPKLSGAFLGVF